MLSLILVPLALAGSACDEVRSMVAIGLPEQAITEAMQMMELAPEELACLEQAGLSEALLQAAEARVVTPPPQAAEVSVEAPEPEPSPALPPPGAVTGPVPPVPERFLLASTTPTCMPAHLLLTTPDPGAAALLSGAVGFGAGNFYARQPGMGMLAAAPQLVGVGVAGIGMGLLTQPDSLPQGIALLSTGLSLLVVGRLGDIGLAVKSAHDTRIAALDRCGL